MTNFQQMLDVAVDAARAAGTLLMEGIDIENRIVRKQSRADLVTEYDTAAEALIVERLVDAFPDHGLLGEEGTQRGGAGRFTWFIDPLDGTTNFARGYPNFTVSLGLYEGFSPRVGVVYDPNRDECFTAVAGQGAFVERQGRRRRLQTSATHELIDSLLVTGFPYDRQTTDEDNVRQVGAFLKRSLGIRRSGSAARDLAYVAAGRLDGYWELKINSWDIAAGVLLILEAGGQVSLLDGSPLHVHGGPPVGVVASNGHIHQQLIDVLHLVASGR